MESQTKVCQNCKKDFIIEPDDFSFYEKMKVPPPTFCPECRRQRRLAWYNLVNLFHRDCDLCGDKFISMYPPEAPYTVYCPKCWWSDKWDFQDFGMDYDFAKPFFTQFNELMHKAPLLGLSINSTTTVGSPYNNHAQDLKDCYLTFDTAFNQECAYGALVVRNRESLDCSMVMDCDTVYDCMNLYKSSHCVGTRGNIQFCIDCYFVRDCINCQDCFICSGLKNKKYCFKNKQLSKEEYENVLKEYSLATYNGYKKAINEATQFWGTIPPKPSWDTMSVDCTGSYVFFSKNCKECYDVADSENLKYCLMLYKKNQKDSYDISGFGNNLNLAYEGGVIGDGSNIFFSQETGINVFYVEYCKLALGGHYQFGCVSAHNGEYCILNKQYTKEEYNILREKIIKHMDEMPYVDKMGNTYKYGEFFPIELSPFPYNMTFAQLFNPKTKDEMGKMGGYYLEENKNEYKITKKPEDIENNIKDVEDNILDEVIGCEKCSRGYKIIEMELRFLRKMKLPIPRECPFCRIDEKLNLWVDNMHLKDRICDKCGIDFKTHWGKERAPIIYCKECYKSEFL